MFLVGLLKKDLNGECGGSTAQSKDERKFMRRKYLKKSLEGRPNCLMISSKEFNVEPVSLPFIHDVPCLIQGFRC